MIYVPIDLLEGRIYVVLMGRVSVTISYSFHSLTTETVKYTNENSFTENLAASKLGLCDMDKKYISRFFDIFFDFDFNHDFDTNRHALSYTSCFCTSYLSCTSCFALFFILLHILLFISFFYLYICSCVVLLL